MFDYARTEFLRFRGWAIACAALHLVVLGFLSRVTDLAQQPMFTYRLFAAVYVVSGLLLGAYQMGNYRRPNAWLQLLHRPVAHRGMASGLMLAAAALLAVAVLLPGLLATAWQEVMTDRIVDQRHLWLVVAGWLLACCGYLVGAFALLANPRQAVAGVVFLLALASARASGTHALLLQLCALAWLAAMVAASFKPDRMAPPRGALATLAIAVPLQAALWCGLLLLGVLVEIAWIASGTHPNNPPVPIAGSAKDVENMRGPERIVAGLRGTRVAEAALWREQAALSDVAAMGASLEALPARHALGNVAPIEFTDATRRVRWVFSHDDMRFHGLTLAEQRGAGTLGVLGQQRFARPPLVVGGGVLATDRTLYQFDEEAGRILPRASLPHGEHVVGLELAGERIGVLSDRALYLYDARDLAISDAPLPLRLRVPTPGRVGMLAQVDLLELLDGVLVSYTFTRNVFRGAGTPYQALVHVDDGGRVTPVARRDLPSGYPAVYLDRAFIASPALHALRTRILGAFAGYASEWDVPPHAPSRATVLLAAALLAASLLLGAWRTRQLGLPMPARLAWIAGCGVVGVPALLSLWLLYPPRQRVDVAAPRTRLPRDWPRPRLAAALATTGLLSAAMGIGGASAAAPVLRDGAGLRALAAAESARAAPPRLPRATFLAQPVLRDARLAPDGRRVVALVENGRDRSVWVADAANPTGRRLLARSGAEDLAFSHDGRWVFLVAPTQVYALAMAGQPGSGALARVGGRTHRAFHGVDPWRPAAVLLLERPPRLSPAPARWRLWRMAIGAAPELLHTSRLEIVDAAFAPDGALSHLRLAVGDAHAILRRDAVGAWRVLARCTQSRQCGFVGTANRGRDLLLNSNLGGDRMRLQRLGADGRRTALHGDPRGEADLAEVVLDPRDNAPLLAAYRSTVAGNHALRPDLRPALDAATRRFPGANLRIEVGHGAAGRWLLRERGGALRGERLHLFDPRSGTSTEVFAHLAFQLRGKPVPRLPVAQMARQVPVSWPASDGLRLHGFLWLPPGRDAARSPLVTLVHGGPYNHVKPEFVGSAQFLANRGYVVFAPNFRASTGHGRRYVLSSQGDFGGDGRVQRDIVEGTHWLLANGIGDAARVGIVGASFGGYATLLGLSFQPGLFKVGAASVPPSDFAFVIGEYLGSGKQLMPGVPMAATLRHLGVDPADRALMARLHTGSPVANVARMRRPLLLLAGGEDDRVPIRGVTDYAARLKLLGRDVSLFVDAEAGHGIADPRTREAYLYLQEVLLHRHLGGLAAEPPGPELRAHLKRNLRLRGPSLADTPGR